MRIHGNTFECTVPEHWSELAAPDRVHAASPFPVKGVAPQMIMREFRATPGVAEVGTLRAGAQTASPLLLGAAAGAAFGGPVGVIVGIGTGIVMSLPAGDGKPWGDRVSDVVEDAWTWIKGVFG